MAANERFILEFVTKGVDNIDKATQKITNLDAKVNALASTILGVSFVNFISGALQAADRIVDFSDATNISIASLKALEAAMNKAGGNGKNLERAIGQLFSTIESANNGSLQARDAFNKVGVSLSDLKNLSEADILQKTLEGLAQMPAGAERSAAATQLLGRSFRSIDPAALLEALDPEKYRASEEANKKAAEQNQKLENSYKSLQEGAIKALEPIINLLGDTELNAGNATKIIQGLGISFGVLFGAQAIGAIATAVGAIIKLNTALKGTAVIQAGLQALQGPKGWAILAGAGAAAAASLYALNQILDETEAKGQAAAESVGKIDNNTAATTNKITAATPQLGAAGRQQELDARQRAVIESNRRIALSLEEERKNKALETADEIQKIRETSASEIARAELEIFGKENLSKEQKTKEFAAKRKEIESKADLDINNLRQQQNQQLVQQRQQYNDQIKQLIGSEKTELQKINDLIDQQPDKYKETAEQMRANASRQDQLLTQLRDFNKEQEKAKKLQQDQSNIIISNTEYYAEYLRQQERTSELLNATSSIEKDMINIRYDETKRLIDLEKTLSTFRDFQNAILREDVDLSMEQGQAISDHLDKYNQLKQILEDIIRIRQIDAQVNYEFTRSFAYGWQQALDEYVENSQNAAKQAKMTFDTFTKGVEDIFVRLLTRQKVNFRDFVNQIIANFARIQVEKGLTALLTSGFGQNFIGKFLGMGSGFGTGMGFGNQDFGGFFAEGGRLGAGKYGIAGENGPELITGPATITPLMAQPQATTINYNINAVDAASFRALVARDPQFIYAVTEQGRRSQPNRRLA